jgi:hypothetical protein
MARVLLAGGRISLIDTERFVSTIHDAARSGLFSMSLTTFAGVATAPTP